MLVLVYRKCSTCQKALRWLDEHKIFFEERPIIEENPTYEELKEWYEKMADGSVVLGHVQYRTGQPQHADGTRLGFGRNPQCHQKQT